MYCKNCGKEVEEGKEYCADCESKNDEVVKESVTSEEAVVTETTTPETTKTTTNSNANTNTNANTTNTDNRKSKMAAGLFGIFLGQFGVHNFYLGYTTKAIIQVCVSSVGLLLACCTGGISCLLNTGMGIWGLIEGILILSGSINTDGKGNPLRD